MLHHIRSSAGEQCSPLIGSNDGQPARELLGLADNPSADDYPWLPAPFAAASVDNAEFFIALDIYPEEHDYIEWIYAQPCPAIGPCETVGHTPQLDHPVSHYHLSNNGHFQ